MSNPVEDWRYVEALLEHPGWGVLLREAGEHFGLLTLTLRRKAGGPEGIHIAGKMEGMEYMSKVLPEVMKSRAEAIQKQKEGREE